MHALLALSVGVSLPSATRNTISVVTGMGGGKQSLPLALCKWPIWWASPGAVTCVPGTAAEAVASAAAADEVVPSSFVYPAGFEQLWLPEDLPLPSSRLAVGAVLRDGVPLYLFPSVETVVTRRSGGGGGLVGWHNRGLNSLPLGGTWMPWAGAGPPERLRLSAFSRRLPPLADQGAAPEGSSPEEERRWARVAEPAAVGQAVALLLGTLADAPDELGEGYQFLLAPLPGEALPEGAVQPGVQLGLVLSDALSDPDLNEPGWADEAGCFAAADIAVYQVPPGGRSEYLPACYKPLYSGAAPR